MTNKTSCDQDGVKQSAPKPLHLSVVDLRCDVALYITVDGVQNCITGKTITIDGWSLVRMQNGIISESSFAPTMSAPLNDDERTDQRVTKR